MPSRFGLLQCIGKAAVKNIVNLVSFGVGGDLLVDVWDHWRRATKEEQRAAEVQAVAQLSPAELRAEVARIVREEAATLPAAQQDQIASYLTQVPAAIHRSLRRPSDPTGTTLAPDVIFRAPEDLLPLLPAALPRFKVGDHPLPGVDRELVELLGVGGFGEVWKARNPHYDGVAPVALKFCQDARARDRLLKHEAGVLNQVMRQGKHKGIVPLLNTYLSADPPCLEYEYIDGGDLAGLIQERRGGLSVKQAAQVIQQLAEIVGFAHRLSPPIVHRDLKPANILVKLRPGGKFALRITDFGIGGLAIQQAVEHSKNGGRGTFLASAVRGAYTPLYASSQQMRGEAPDPRDDVYALGVIWYQMITGDLTKGRPGGEAWRKRLADLGMTPVLLALLASTYEDESEDRPASAVVLAENLDQVLRQEGQERQRQEQDEEARRMQEATEREEQQRAEKQHRREERERQERELERLQGENLRRWRDSGHAQEWVEEQRGEWDQAEWRKLVETLKQSDLWPLKLDAVRTLLEELKRDYQVRMEVVRRSQIEAERIRRQVERRRTEQQTYRANPPRPEPPRTRDEGRVRPIREPKNEAKYSKKRHRLVSDGYLLLGGGLGVMLLLILGLCLKNALFLQQRPDADKSGMREKEMTREKDMTAKNDSTPPQRPLALTQREKRMLRWSIPFDTSDAVEYISQLQGLGAILAIPVREDAAGRDYRLVRDLSARPAKLLNEDITQIQSIYWIDDKSQSVIDVMAVLQVPLTRAPSHFVIFIPKELEAQLLKLEIAYFELRHKGRGEDDILSTNFRINRIGAQYIPEVIAQKVK